jgi:hypothetical protein
MVASGDAQPDPSIHPNNGMRAHPPDAHSDGMRAKKRAGGGREPRRYEIGVRGPIGPTMMADCSLLNESLDGRCGGEVGGLACRP